MEDDTEATQLLAQLDAMEIVEPGITVAREAHRAKLQIRNGELDKAAATFQAAIEIAGSCALRSDEAEIHQQLRDLAQQRNDFASYVEHNNEFTRITEEINGRDTATKLAMQEKQREIDAREKEHAKHMAVLHSTLPKHIADRVARGETVNDHYDNASVIFLDIVGFTTISSQLDSRIVIEILDDVFTKCDAVCAKHDVTKIKTIGDSYMAVAFPSDGDAAERAAHAAIEMMQITLNEVLNKALNEAIVKFRIGIHRGPLTAGVIGTARMQYDVWGDTVNVASRMESTSETGKIHVSESFASAVKGEKATGRNGDAVTLTERGEIEVKGKGLMKTYWLE